jgi:hypothetical protein
VGTSPKGSADALLLLYELADREDKRYQSAAARWHARFVLEAGLPLGEAQMVMNMLSEVSAVRAGTSCGVGCSRRSSRRA